MAKWSQFNAFLLLKRRQTRNFLKGDWLCGNSWVEFDKLMWGKVVEETYCTYTYMHMHTCTMYISLFVHTQGMCNGCPCCLQYWEREETIMDIIISSLKSNKNYVKEIVLASIYVRTLHLCMPMYVFVCEYI